MKKNVDKIYLAAQNYIQRFLKEMYYFKNIKNKSTLQKVRNDVRLC